MWNDIENRLLKYAEVPPGSPDQLPPQPEDLLTSDCPPPGVELDDPHWLSSRYLGKYRSPEGLRLRYWREEFYVWNRGSYSPFPEDDLNSDLSAFIEGEFLRDHERQRKAYDPSMDKDEPIKLKVSVHLIRDVLMAIKSGRSSVPVPSDRDAPTWLSDSLGDPADLISMPFGILNIPQLVDRGTDYLLPLTTEFFTLNRIEFQYDSDSPEPIEWLKFLKQLWPNDPSSIDCLQEWFGYLLTPDISLHKILLIIGPTRAGKGTIG